MAKSPTQIVDHIRQQLVTNILAGPKPPLDEMSLLSQEYQDVWGAKGEVPDDAILATVLDEPGQWFNKPRTPAEHAFDQDTERLLRKKRWVESEQLTNLAKVETLLADNERSRQSLLKHNRKLNRQSEKCRVDSEQATTPAQATAAQHRFRQCQKVRQANLSKLARVRQTEEKVLRSARRNAIEYLGMVKKLEARKGYRKLLRKRERAASGGLGFLGTLGAILAINDFQKMAHGIDKLAKKK
jgi:hypothetical protein